MSPDTPFDEDFLSKLQHLSVISRRFFAGQSRADRRSRKRGSGLEFADYRAYSQGDDFRYLDWRAYLRLDKLLLRLFEEEEDLPIYILIDSSASMTFGRPSKIDHAKKIAAALSYIGLANLDRVNVISYGDTLRQDLRAQRGRGRILKIFKFITEIEPGGKTDLTRTLKAFCSESRRQGLIVLISDLMDSSGIESALRVIRPFRHDVFVVHVVAREDIDPATHGEVSLMDSESHETRNLYITPDIAASYRKTFERFCNDIEQHCKRSHMGYIRTLSDFPFEDLILKLFRHGRFLK